MAEYIDQDFALAIIQEKHQHARRAGRSNAGPLSRGVHRPPTAEEERPADMKNRNRFDITPHIDYIRERIAAGDSLRMIAKSLSISHDCLLDHMKKSGIYVPSKQEAAKNTWKNHTHPHLGKKGGQSYLFGRKLSEKAMERSREASTGPNNYHWCGGRKMHSEGYILCYHPEHPFANKHGFVMEHRYIMEQHLGRFLSPDEIVHHKNGIKTDNRVENLSVLSRNEHAKHHMNELIGGKKRAQRNRNQRKANG